MKELMTDGRVGLSITAVMVAVIGGVAVANNQDIDDVEKFIEVKKSETQQTSAKVAEILSVTKENAEQNKQNSKQNQQNALQIQEVIGLVRELTHSTERLDMEVMRIRDKK